MKAWVINLVARTDRWLSVEQQRDLLEIPIERVNAISQDFSAASRSLVTAPGVNATWHSHLKAMKLFLKSEDDFALILEDDFVLKRPLRDDFTRHMKSVDLDFLQLGFLKPHFLDGFMIQSINLQDRLLKMISRSRVFGRRLNSKHLVEEQKGVPKTWVLNDVRAGGHAYIVSRHFASAIQDLNNPTCLSTDGFYMALGVSRNFKMARLRKSLIRQSNSPSSVSVRFRADKKE